MKILSDIFYYLTYLILFLSFATETSWIALFAIGSAFASLECELRRDYFLEAIMKQLNVRDEP